MPRNRKNRKRKEGQSKHQGQNQGHSHGEQNRTRNQPSNSPFDEHGRRRRVENKPDEVLEAEHYVDVLNHFSHHATHSFQRVEKFERDLKYIDPVLKSMVPNIDQRLKDIKDAIRRNHIFVRDIIDCRHVFMQNPRVNYDKLPVKRLDEERMSKVRSTVRQTYRDWSVDGAAERKQCYGPLLDDLERLFPRNSDGATESEQIADRGDIRVLVPGSGLGRLVWEVANRGFASQGNEFSYFMLLASYVILNCCKGPNVYTLFPFVYQNKNLLEIKDQTMPVKIPDVNPSVIPSTANFSMVAGDFLEVYGDQPEEWDCVASCFFIDCANNVLEYVRTIAKILKPGGYWCNFGPLLYHYAGMRHEISIELTWEEIKGALPYLGLKLIEEEYGLEAIYASHPRGMLQQRYSCLHFVCQKVDAVPTPAQVSDSTGDDAPENKNNGDESTSSSTTTTTPPPPSTDQEQGIQSMTAADNDSETAGGQDAMNL